MTQHIRLARGRRRNTIGLGIIIFVLAVVGAAIILIDDSTKVNIINDLGVGAFSYVVTSGCGCQQPRLSTTHRHTPSMIACYRRAGSHVMSTVGGGSSDNPNDNDNDDEYDPLREWITPPASDTNDPDGGVRRLREEEARAESRLPVSFGAITNNNEDENNDRRFGPMMSGNPPDIQLQQIGGDDFQNDNSSTSLSPPPRSNPYLPLITRLTPSELISRFTSSAPPRVQDAVRTTILGLIGGLASHMKFNTRAVATGERLANLMFQLQMTGYMFKNAEYQLGLSQTLGSDSVSSVATNDRGGSRMLGGDVKDGMRDGRLIDGTIKVRYGGGTGGGGGGSSGFASSNDDGLKDMYTSSTTHPPSVLEVEVNAKAYMSELRREVKRLRDELEVSKQAREDEIRKDLLAYIRTLPKGELQRLTGTMSPEVLDAMKGLVTAVLSGIGEDEEEDEDENSVGRGGDKIIGPRTVTEQSGEALAQLCMWQLVVGYNLRELEVREELRTSMMEGANEKSQGDGGGGNNSSSSGEGLDEWR